MQTLILTVIGDDRAGLVSALADIVTTNGGNWERNQLAELAGKFAGIVVVTVPDERAADFRVALAPLSGLLDVTVHTAEGEVAQEPARGIRLDLVGNDSPGSSGAVSGVLTRHGVNVDELATTTTSAPMAGGHFEATSSPRCPRRPIWAPCGRTWSAWPARSRSTSTLTRSDLEPRPESLSAPWGARRSWSRE